MTSYAMAYRAKNVDRVREQERNSSAKYRGKRQRRARPDMPKIGEVFGELTVTGIGKKIGSRNEPACEVKCKCGVKKLVRAYTLRADCSKTCGKCIRRKKIRPDSDWRRVLGYYRSGANSRNRNSEFNLTLQQVKVICQMVCAYCGAEPNNTIRRKPGEPVVLRYSGIDRIDSSGHYMAGNVVPCCKFCNRAKNNLTLEEFIDQIRRFGSPLRVADILSIAEEISHDDANMPLPASL